MANAPWRNWVQQGRQEFRGRTSVISAEATLACHVDNAHIPNPYLPVISVMHTGLLPVILSYMPVPYARSTRQCSPEHLADDSCGLANVLVHDGAGHHLDAREMGQSGAEKVSQ